MLKHGEASAILGTLPLQWTASHSGHVTLNSVSSAQPCSTPLPDLLTQMFSHFNVTLKIHIWMKMISPYPKGELQTLAIEVGKQVSLKTFMSV
jgi:hypothetical protein